MTDIPNGWTDVALEDICQIVRGITFPTTEKRFQPETGLIACLRTANVQVTVEWEDLWFVPRRYMRNDDQLVLPDDILISTANSYELVGKVSRVTHTKFDSTLGAFISLLRAYNGVNARFLYYQMSSEIVQRKIREMSSTTTNISNVSGAKLKSLELNLAPAAEQTRIVEKLEELLSDLDAGVAELKAAQKKLTQYRQSLLKAAVEGTLTAEWRAARAAPLPPRGGGAGGEGAKARQVTSAIQQQHARELRSNQMPTERELWQQLRAKRFSGFKFRRQQPLGRYIVDFVCFEKRLIIELDGSQHADQQDYDTERDAWLQAQGFRVLRFWNNQWTAQPEAVLEAIWLALQEERPPLPNPSPARGEGLETGAQLLKRILTERRARWEAKQLAKFKEQGKAPPKDWQKKYPEPVQPDTAGLPELPKGWVWASVDQLSESVRNGLSKTPNTEGRGYPIFRINAVRPMAVNFSAIKHIEISEEEAADYWVEVGDVLATRYNGSVDLLGVFGMIKKVPVSTLHPDKLIRMKPVLGANLGAWMEICGNVGLSRKHLVSRVKTTAGQTGISGEDLKKTPIPLAPLAEQDIVLAAVRERWESIRDLETSTDLSLKQSAAQRQNILRAAFAGQLVPQDPNDEPASVLLERIRAERAARSPTKSPGRKTKSASV